MQENIINLIDENGVESQFEIILSLDSVFVTLFVYALTKPPAPNFIPPKYLTTIARMLFRTLFSNTLRIGIPAVPPGSPSSEDFFKLFNIYA